MPIMVLLSGVSFASGFAIGSGRSVQTALVLAALGYVVVKS